MCNCSATVSNLAVKMAPKGLFSVACQRIIRNHFKKGQFHEKLIVLDCATQSSSKESVKSAADVLDKHMLMKNILSISVNELEYYNPQETYKIVNTLNCMTATTLRLQAPLATSWPEQTVLCAIS